MELLQPSPFEYTLSLIGGKWKMIIMFRLSHRGTMRYGEVKKEINEYLGLVFGHTIKI